MDFSKMSIDVSKWDARDNKNNLVVIDWEATGMPIALIKSSQAKSTDPAFLVQWDAASVIPRVAYHYFDYRVNAIQQAEYAWSVVRHDFTENDYLAIDFEHFLGGLTADPRNWNPMNQNTLLALGSMLYELEKKIPVEQLMIYTGTSFWYPCGGKTATWAKKYKHWQAQWLWDNYFANLIKLPPYILTEKVLSEKISLIENGIAKPVECLPWGLPDIWQFTARLDPKLLPVGSYPGNKAAVDLNYIYMDLEPAPAYKTCPTCNGTGKIVI